MGTKCIRGKTLCPTFKGWKWGYLVSPQKETGTKGVAMATIEQAPVVQRLDNAIHRINRYPADKC